jgi:hypothetical protein
MFIAMARGDSEEGLVPNQRLPCGNDEPFSCDEMHER